MRFLEKNYSWQFIAFPIKAPSLPDKEPVSTRKKKGIVTNKTHKTKTSFSSQKMRFN